DICAIAKYDPWFVRQIAEIVKMEKDIKSVIPAKAGIQRAASVAQERLDASFRWHDKLGKWKRDGFSDARIAELAGVKTAEVAALRGKLDIHPVYKRVDTCSSEFESATPYMYSTYECPSMSPPQAGGMKGGECEAEPTAREKIIILGGGPNRIGQGIEF